LLLSEPGILGRVQRFEVLDADTAEALVVEIDKSVAFSWSGAEQRLTQIDAVEDDRIAVIVLPIVGRRLKPGELRNGRPSIHVGSHVPIDGAGLDMARPSGEAGTRKPPSKEEPFMPRNGV
jgi:hypothetical protein